MMTPFERDTCEKLLAAMADGRERTFADMARATGISERTLMRIAPLVEEGRALRRDKVRDFHVFQATGEPMRWPSKRKRGFRLTEADRKAIPDQNEARLARRWRELCKMEGHSGQLPKAFWCAANGTASKLVEKRRKRVVRALRGKELAPAEVANKLGIGIETITNDLAVLSIQGRAERTQGGGAGKRALWTATT